MTRVDSHVHFWRLERGDYSWLTPAAGPLFRDFQPGEILPLMTACAIQRAVAELRKRWVDRPWATLMDVSHFGVGIGVTYWAMAALLEAMGSVGQLPPLLSGWSPDIIFFFLGMYFFFKMPT